MMKAFGVLIAAVSIGLLVLSALGDSQPRKFGYDHIGHDLKPAIFNPSPWDRFEESDADGVRALVGALNLPGKEAARAKAVFKAVTLRFYHHRAEYSPFTNWILWLAGFVLPEAGNIRDPDLVLKFGASGLCGQQAGVLGAALKKAGITARLVNLEGHTVAEAWIGERWVMLDPDYEVTGFMKRRMVSVHDIGAERLAPVIYSQSNGKKLAGYYETQDDTVSMPPGVFTLSPDYLRLETFINAFYLKYLVPLMGLMLGLRRLTEPSFRTGNSVHRPA